MWLDGTPMDYVNWDLDQPGDVSYRRYGEIRSADGTWRDASSWRNYKPFICETPKGKTMQQTAACCSNVFVILSLISGSYLIDIFHSLLPEMPEQLPTVGKIHSWIIVLVGLIFQNGIH